MRLDIGIKRDIQGALGCAVAPYFCRRALLFLGRRAQHSPGLLHIKSDKRRIAIATRHLGQSRRCQRRRHRCYISLGCGRFCGDRPRFF